ncbi:hypothetical protein LIER_19360 [Lithospermum erythrorhizon]|uniref:Retrovirus-related Pol polyprotein from transposon TNT 1-94-like beta-barrel domain-containing protein n=1 Tax=Lithospermum erythrorhizon TaxID=34254 RepID=A0AAV3QIZ0_LITER
MHASHTQALSSLLKIPRKELSNLLLTIEAKMNQKAEAEISMNMATRNYVGHSGKSFKSRSYPNDSINSQKSFVRGRPGSWYVDSGASNHLTSDIQNMSLHNGYSGHDQITVGNGATLPKENIGTSTLSTPYKSLTLNNILHVPAITKNFLSISQLATDNNVYL